MKDLLKAVPFLFFVCFISYYIYKSAGLAATVGFITAYILTCIAGVMAMKNLEITQKLIKNNEHQEEKLGELFENIDYNFNLAKEVFDQLEKRMDALESKTKSS
jgi:LDH2 family malate/lactate/ureidoglycolate dehydrogenase